MRARRPRLVGALALALAIAGLAAGCSFGPVLRGVFVVERAGGKPKQLLPPRALPFVPTWSPDGRRMAYVEVDSYRSAIVVTDRNGRRLARFGHSRFPGGEPVAWSPDGKLVAYIHVGELKRPPYERIELVVARTDGSAPRTLAATTLWRLIDRGPAWSPSGSFVVWSRERDTPEGNLDVLVVNVRSGESRAIAAGEDDEFDPRWSPDGRTILLTRLRGESDWETLWLVAPDGTSQRRLAGPFVGLFAAWSPDGSRIAFVGAAPRDESARLWVVRPDGSDLHALANRVVYGRPAWTPDGRLIAFAKSDGIDVVRPDGTDRRTLVEFAGTDVDSLAWSPGGTELLFEAERRSEGD